MKKYLKHILYFSSFCYLMALTGCNDKDTEEVSKVTTYAVISRVGDEFISIPQGQAFSDPGATATESGSPISIVTAGSVDVNTPGVYTITYTATNADGFSVSTTRNIGVIAPDAAAEDLSGNYKRNAGAQGISKVTKLGMGHYTTDNVGGVAAGGPATTVHFFHTTGTTLIVPVQNNGSGEFSAINASYKFANGGAPAQYTWTVINAGYLDNARTFVKQ